MTRSKKIIMIDDSSTIRRTGELLLAQSGHQVSLAEDGVSGIAAIMKNKPDVVFLDVMMPGINGLDICSILKSDPHYKDIPIVMLTSKDTHIDRMRGKLYGANEYLVKPFSKWTLLAAVDNALNPQIKN